MIVIAWFSIIIYLIGVGASIYDSINKRVHPFAILGTLIIQAMIATCLIQYGILLL